MKNRISIIIPCYNVEQDIRTTLQCILMQTYTNLEVLCVNDGSTDGSLQVLQEIAKSDARVKVFDKPNGGVTSARLYGLEQATGDWISFIDGDDTIDADMYERLLANVTADDIDISHCGYKKIFPGGMIEYYHNTGKRVEQDTHTGCMDLLKGETIEPGLVNKLYRKTLFDGLSDWLDISIKINEDLLMNFFLFRNSRKSVYEDFCPYHYIVRLGSASASKINENKLYDPIRVMDKLIEETIGNVGLQDIAKSRLTYLLINGTTQIYGDKKELVKSFRKYTLRRLRKMLKSILKEKCYTKGRKLCALWVSVWPASYRLVHRICVKQKYKRYKEIYPWL